MHAAHVVAGIDDDDDDGVRVVCSLFRCNRCPDQNGSLIDGKQEPVFVPATTHKVPYDQSTIFLSSWRAFFFFFLLSVGMEVRFIRIRDRNRPTYAVCVPPALLAPWCHASSRYELALLTLVVSPETCGQPACPWNN